MIASYTIADGTCGNIEYEAIIPQAMSHGDGFVLLGFDDWEDVNDEKPSGGISNVVSFKIDRTKKRTGFYDKESD